MANAGLPSEAADLPPVAKHILDHLLKPEVESATQGEIMDAHFYSRRSVVRRLDQLSEAGLVETDPCASDGRSQVYRPTVDRPT